MISMIHRSSTLAAARVLPLVLAMIASSGLSRPARADLVIRDVNVTLDASNISTYDLDVNLDGKTDFTFTAAYVPDPVLSVGFDTVDFPFGGNNGVVVDAATSAGFPTASRLATGDLVSDSNIFSSASFDQGNLFFFTTFDPPSGNFGGRSGFLGLRFDSAGGTLFGFAEITVNALDAPVNPLGLTIGAVGFDDVPGRSVRVVPEPSSLALIGLGLLGKLGLIRRWRGRARKVDAP